MAFVPATPLTAIRSAPLSTTHCPARSVRRARSAAPTLHRRSARMVATETEATKAIPLSPKAKELLAYIRGHKSIFSPGVGFNSTHCTLFRKNDTGRCFTPLDELATNAHVLSAGSVAAVMVVQEEALVEAALAAAVEAVPELEDDATAKEIFKFDMRAMIRVISYGAACQSTDFIHKNNLGIMKMLHQEVGVPTRADSKGLKAARDMVLMEVTDAAIAETTASCFAAVIDFMS